MNRLPPRHMHTFGPACLVLLLVTCRVVAAPSHAPLRPAGMGSAVAVEFSIHPDSLRPGEPVRILACATNQNPSSTRDLMTGDSLVFEFTRGTVGACSDVALALPTTTLLESDFACSVDGNTLAITYNGSTAAWSPGEAICASVIYTPEDAPSIVLTQMAAVFARRGRSVIAVQNVEANDTRRYGIVRVGDNSKSPHRIGSAPFQVATGAD